MELIKNLNLAIRFLIELCMVAALSFSGVHLTNIVVLKWILGIGLPLAAVVIWGVFLSPKASHSLTSLIRTVLECFLFGLAAIGLIYTGNVLPGILLAVVFLFNKLLLIVWNQ